MEPFGEVRADLRMQRICSTYAQLKGAEDAGMDAFAFQFDEEDVPDVDEDEQEELFKRKMFSFIAKTGGKIVQRAQTQT